MSCEGSTSAYVDQKPQASIDNVANYANSGGRLFLSHLHSHWLQKKMPDFSGTATYVGNIDPPGDVRGYADDQRHVPERYGAGRLVGRGERQPDAWLYFAPTAPSTR